MFKVWICSTPDYETPICMSKKEGNMNKRILIAYATKAGSSAEIASAIAETLSTRGYIVDIIGNSMI